MSVDYKYISADNHCDSWWIPKNTFQERLPAKWREIGPRVVDGQVTVRDVLDLTLAIDHNIVDGAPFARFGAEFRALLESAAVISPSN